MTNINLNLYKIFCAVATSKSYAEASEKLEISVSNISTQISNLENQLDTKLFDRERKGIILTESGKELYEIVYKSILNFEYGEKVLKEKNNLESGKIKIGCPSHIFTYYLMDCIEIAKKEYPNLTIEIVSNANANEMLKQLKSHKIDFILIDNIRTNDNNVIVEKWKTADNIFVSKKDIKINNINDLEKMKYILNFEYTNTNKKLIETLNKYKLKINCAMRCDVTEIRVEAVKKGFGIGYVMRKAVEQEIKNGELYEVKIPIVLPSIDINLVYIKDRLTKVDKSFIKKYLK